MEKRLDKILLIHPMDPSLSEQTPFAPFSLICLAASVEDLVEVKILDATAKNVDMVMQEVNDFAPQWVGISVIYTFFIPGAIKIARAIKSQYGDSVKVIAGGHGVTFVPDEILRTGVIDAVVRGEGEVTFREMVTRGTFIGVHGTSHWFNGEIQHNPPRPLLENLDELPLPAYHLVDMSSVDFFQIETSRGCPYRCTFCDTSRFYGHTWRAKSPERVLQEFKLLAQYGQPGMTLLTDDNINTDMRRVDRICELLLKEGLNFPLQIQMRSDDISRNPDTIARLAQIGTKILIIGLESGSQETLNAIRKGVQLEHVVRASELCRRNGIHLLASYMIGLPHETAESAECTTRFAMETADSVAINLFTPYPGTAMYDQCKRDGLLLTEDWGQYDQHHPIVKTAKWPAVDFEKIRNDMCRLFYNRADWIESHFVAQPGTSGGLAVFTRNFYSAWAGYYDLEAWADWAEVLEGYRTVANQELGSRCGNYSAKLRLVTDILTMDLEVQAGQLQQLQSPNGQPDFTIRTDNKTLNKLLRLMTQDALSAFIEGKITMDAAWTDMAAFVRWCDALQEVVDVRVVKRAPDEPTCLPALTHLLAGLPEPKPHWLSQGGRYLLKTDGGALLLGLRGGRASEFRLHTGERTRRIREEITLAPGVIKELLTGDWKPLLASLDS